MGLDSVCLPTRGILNFRSTKYRVASCVRNRSQTLSAGRCIFNWDVPCNCSSANVQGRIVAEIDLERFLLTSHIWTDILLVPMGDSSGVDDTFTWSLYS
jgi:hypothetical protein